MIANIIEFSVRQRFVIFFLTGFLCWFGFESFQKLSIDAVPDITNTQVQINTPVVGLVPEEIERMVTFPIESAMGGIPGVETVRSISRFGISQVTIIFKDNSDIYRARQLVAEKLQLIELPAGIKPEMGPIATGLGEIFHYSIEAKEVATDPQERLLQLMELRSLQDWVIKPRLLTVAGVTEVNTIGGYEKQFFIQPNIKRLNQYGLSFDDLEHAITNNNANVGGGYIQQTGEQLLVRGVGLLSSIEDIENVVVKRLPSLDVIRVRDVAKVRLDKQIRTGAGTVNGEESIIGTAFMLLGENSRSVATRVGERLDEIKKDLPDWVKIQTLYDRSDMVQATLATVEHNLFMGASLVIVFLLLLVGNFRAALITSATIPVSLLMTFILMRWQNVSGNLMSLGALDFGIIVDGAVIVVENCVHRLQERAKAMGRELTRQELRQLVIDSACEIRQAAGFGELIVIVVFVPLFVLTGVEGKMFVPMATTFVMALLSALLLSFTLVPALCATFLSGKIKDKTPWLMRLAARFYRPLLHQAVAMRKAVAVFALGMIALGIGLFTQLGAEFIPQLDEGDFAVQFIRPANINTSSSIELQRLSEKVILQFPQVKSVFARTGAAEVATDPMGVNISDSYVMLKKKEEWPKDSPIQSKEALMQAVRERLEALVAAQVLLISQPVELRFNELLEGTRADVSAKLYGPDLDVLLAKASEMAQIIATVEGAGEVESESKGKSPMLEYRPKKDVLANLGVSTGPVLEAIETAIGGREVGHLYEGVRRYPIIVRLSEQERQSIETVRALPVSIGEGHIVPIESVSAINYVETFTAVARENSERRIAVLINPNTRDLESFVNLARDEVEKKLELPEGYYVEWGGSFKNLQSAKERLAILVPIAMLVIIGMLWAAFRNFAQVALIFLCAPMALVGGVVALMLMQMPFSISAGVGFIALSGISILNGVVLVSYFNRLYADGVENDEVVKLGAMTRLRPVLMTALTDIFGFLPMMFSTGLGAEVQKPLATVVVGGMMSATLLTLIVLPSLYRLFVKYMRPK